MMNDRDEEICADCDDLFDLYDGFLGNPDINDENCSMFTEIVPLCRKCAERRGIVLDDDKDR